MLSCFGRHFFSGFDHPAPVCEPEPQPLTLRAQTLASLPWRTASGHRFASTKHLTRWLLTLAP
jgi:hypothetical protein